MAFEGLFSPEETTQNMSHFGEMGVGAAGECHEMSGREAALETPKTTYRVSR